MGAYQKAGGFNTEEWNRVVEADEKLVMPVLKEFGARIGDKWRWDGNGYPFWVGEAGFEILFDFEAGGERLVFELRSHTVEGYKLLGTVNARLPRKRWDHPRKVFRTLLSQSLRFASVPAVGTAAHLDEPFFYIPYYSYILQNIRIVKVEKI